jgi:hypothetical protein
VAEPNAGAPKILIAVARMARPECEWLDGMLRVEIEADSDKTRLSIMADLGGGLRELVFPRFVMNAPLDEFQRSLRLAPRAVEPLRLAGDDDPEATRLVLTHAKLRRSSKPISFELAEDCLRKSFPPKVRKSLEPPPGAAERIEIPKLGVPKILRGRLHPPTPAAKLAPVKIRIKPKG